MTVLAACVSLATCARNLSVVVDTCVVGAANQTWRLEDAGAAGRVRLRAFPTDETDLGASRQPGGLRGTPMCAGVKGDSPDLPGHRAIMLIPCTGAATEWTYDPVTGHFAASSNGSAPGCGVMDANVYRGELGSAGANVCCYSPGTGTNQAFKRVSDAAAGTSTFHTVCAGQPLCLTARLHAADGPTPPPPKPPPPPPPPRQKNSLFGPFDADIDGICLSGMRAATNNPRWILGCPCWRIPSVVAVANNTILVFAEGRWFLGDGCEPTPRPSIPPYSAAGDRRAIFARRSTDGGQSFGPIRHVAGNRSAEGTSANPTAVWLPDSNQILMHFDCGTCASSTGHGKTFQIVSNDFGLSWSVPQPLGRYLGPWDGVAPGPGAGLLLRVPPHAGVLFFAGHHDTPTQLDVAWHSQNGGASWTLSRGPGKGGGAEFAGFDEPQFTELRNGSVLMSLRRDSHGTRGQALSTDGGATFVWIAPTIGNLAGGVQQPLISLKNWTVLFAAPDASSRCNLSVWASTDDANTFEVARNVYKGPSAYSSLAQRQSDGVVLLAYERDVEGCEGESCSIEWVML